MKNNNRLLTCTRTCTENPLDQKIILAALFSAVFLFLTPGLAIITAAMSIVPLTVKRSTKRTKCVTVNTPRIATRLPLKGNLLLIFLAGAQLLLILALVCGLTPLELRFSDDTVSTRVIVFLQLLLGTFSLLALLAFKGSVVWAGLRSITRATISVIVGAVTAAFGIKSNTVLTKYGLFNPYSKGKLSDVVDQGVGWSLNVTLTPESVRPSILARIRTVVEESGGDAQLLADLLNDERFLQYLTKILLAREELKFESELKRIILEKLPVVVDVESKNSFWCLWDGICSNAAKLFANAEGVCTEHPYIAGLGVTLVIGLGLWCAGADLGLWSWASAVLSSPAAITALRREVADLTGVAVELSQLAILSAAEINQLRLDLTSQQRQTATINNDFISLSARVVAFIHALRAQDTAVAGALSDLFRSVFRGDLFHIPASRMMELKEFAWIIYKKFLGF